MISHEKRIHCATCCSHSFGYGGHDSKLSTDGGDNSDITISDDTYDGTFRSNERGWDAANWTEE
uniref:hypothetical protein n=1 Tax=Alloprevotella sp. TaxID=1872471 RepID=UPI003FEEE237